MTYSVFSLFPSTQYDFEVLCVFNAWHRFTLHRACALSLSLPGAIKIYMALLASSLCVPVTIGPSISPSPSLSSKVSFPIEAEIRLLPCLCFTTSHGLSCHLLFNSIILFYMHKNPIWIWLVWKKKVGSKPEANSPLLNPPPNSIAILLQSRANAPRRPTSEHGSGQQTSSPINFSGWTQWKSLRQLLTDILQFV